MFAILGFNTSTFGSMCAFVGPMYAFEGSTHTHVFKFNPHPHIRDLSVQPMNMFKGSSMHACKSSMHACEGSMLMHV